MFVDHTTFAIFKNIHIYALCLGGIDVQSN